MLVLICCYLSGPSSPLLLGRGVGVGFFLFHASAAGVEHLSITYDIKDVIDEHFANGLLAIGIACDVLDICRYLLYR